MNTCKVCNKGLAEDEYNLFFTYNKIRETFDDILRGSDCGNTALDATPRSLSINL